MHPNDSESLDSWQARKVRNKAKWGNNGMGTPLGVAVRLWPTPQATNGDQGQNDWDGKRGQTLIGAARDQMWPTPQHRDGDGRGVSGPGSPRYARKAAGAWSLNLDEAVRQGPVSARPTPKARDYRSVSGNEDRHSPDLNVAVAGHLNPAWVCSLQGFPEGWLDIGPPAQASPKQPGRRPGP
jgi:hypothetical protein